jgi:hypothetical protein
MFEKYEPKDEDLIDGPAYDALWEAAAARRNAEVVLADAIAAARAGNIKWGTIGAAPGTSGEAARQRYGRPRREAATARERE